MTPKFKCKLLLLFCKKIHLAEAVMHERLIVIITITVVVVTTVVVVVVVKLLLRGQIHVYR